MKKILIISPHFPPSNLAAVHRSRLFAQHLPSFGWQPIILTVDEKYYEEKLDHNLEKLLPPNLRIEKVNAFKITRPRTIGDIGLRGFFQLLKKTVSLIRSEKIDFLYIPVPSFYTALIGRIVKFRTGILYGIDYIDPWVHTFAGSKKKFSRHWWSTKLSRLLEPFAVKKASLITGVAESYYHGVLQRNPHLKSTAKFAAMPYGGEEEDFKKIADLNLSPYLFTKNENKIQLVYAGAMLPKAYEPLEEIFKSIHSNIDVFKNIELHFIGTGKNTQGGYNIKSMAEKFELWQNLVFEYPQRIPYLDVLVHLQNSDGIFILGSTESHYTPSKIYTGVLSGKPLLAVLHRKSTACEIIKNSGAGIVLAFDGRKDLATIENNFVTSFQNFLSLKKDFTPAMVNKKIFEQYSAKEVTRQLASVLDEIIERK